MHHLKIALTGSREQIECALLEIHDQLRNNKWEDKQYRDMLDGKTPNTDISWKLTEDDTDEVDTYTQPNGFYA